MAAQPTITASAAQCSVTKFVVTQISSQLRGDMPDLRLDEPQCWSVPVILTLPSRGAVGKVGEVLVDAATGEVLADAEDLRTIADYAERLAQRVDWSAPPT